MSSCVQDVVRLLPESFRSVITLFDMAELSHREIADILDTTVENVKVRLTVPGSNCGRCSKKNVRSKWMREMCLCDPVDGSNR